MAEKSSETDQREVSEILSESGKTAPIRLSDIGARLRAFRMGRGLTPEAAAASLGISRAALYRAEKGEIPKIETLTPRERQVMEMVVNGMANKQVAAELGLSEKTIEVHRKHVMDKMQAGNVADLIRMAMRGSSVQTID